MRINTANSDILAKFTCAPIASSDEQRILSTMDLLSFKRLRMISIHVTDQMIVLRSRELLEAPQ